METTGATPANAELAPAGTTETDVEVSQVEGGESASPATEAGTPAPKKDAVQERFDKLTREKYDNARLADQRGYELERLQARLVELEKAKPEPVAPEQFPTLEQYGYDEGKFNAAVAAHFSKIATEQASKVARDQIEAERQTERQRKAGESWASKEAEFIKSKPDYVDKVRGNRDLRITPDMAQVIQGSELGPQVAYHLAENPDKAAAIAALTPLDQAREIGRIEARLEAAKAAKPAVSQAPSPVPKVEGGEAPTSVKVDTADSDNLSDQEWTRRRNAQERAQRRKANS